MVFGKNTERESMIVEQVLDARGGWNAMSECQWEDVDRLGLLVMEIEDDDDYDIFDDDDEDDEEQFDEFGDDFDDDDDLDDDDDDDDL